MRNSINTVFELYFSKKYKSI